MKRILNYILLSGLLVIFMLNTACGIVRNPFRDYSKKTFNSKDWKNGDAIERGRMLLSLTDDPSIEGMNEKQLVEFLGEPDKKDKKNSDEVWLYNVEFSYQSPMKYLAITMDKRTGAFVGSFEDGKVSVLGSNTFYH